MDKIGEAARDLVLVGSPSLRNEIDRDKALAVRQASRTGPAILDRRADIEIPRAVWSGWKEVGKARCLRRPLTGEEIGFLDNRRAELEPWILGYHEREAHDVEVALSEMFDAFPSMGSYGNAQATKRVISASRVLANFPLWAILKCCDKIKSQGYTRYDGQRYVTERQWPPSDPQMVESVSNEVKLYRDSYDSAVALLKAEVEK